MRIWIVSFGILFALAELYQWAKEFISPLPFYILGGVFLAIASNYEKGILPFTKEENKVLNQQQSKDTN